MNEKNIRLDFTRHPEKSGEKLPRQDNPENNIDLPTEGLMQAQEKAVEFAEEFSQAPEGTVVWAITSNAPRTHEARFIFDMELGVIARKTGAEIIDLNGKMPDEQIAWQNANANKSKKIVLVNGPVHPGLGLQNYNVDEYMALAKELGSEAEVIANWESNPEISKRIGVDYEAVKQGYQRMLTDIVNIRQKVLPDREVWIKAFGHSGEIEVGIASYAQRSIGEIIHDAGDSLIGTMESAHIVIRPDGTKSVEYQGRIVN